MVHFLLLLLLNNSGLRWCLLAHYYNISSRLLLSLRVALLCGWRIAWLLGRIAWLLWWVSQWSVGVISGRNYMVKQRLV